MESRELEKDMHYYQSCLEAIIAFSPKAKVFCLVHKMDLIQEDQRDLMFEERESQLQKLSLPLEVSTVPWYFSSQSLSDFLIHTQYLLSVTVI